jgi:hypothetical protein
MTKNITLSADERLIAEARQRASQQHTTLNGAFRDWLLRYAHGGKTVAEYTALMSELGAVDAGRKFTREELNER